MNRLPPMEGITAVLHYEDGPPVRVSLSSDVFAGDPEGDRRRTLVASCLAPRNGRITKAHLEHKGFLLASTHFGALVGPVAVRKDQTLTYTYDVSVAYTRDGVSF